MQFVRRVGECLSVSKGSILITGGAGFIGSNFARHAISNGYQVITLDALTYAGNRANLSEIDANPNHHLSKARLRMAALFGNCWRLTSPSPS